MKQKHRILFLPLLLVSNTITMAHLDKSSLALTVEAFIQAFDQYGQVVVYLGMNGVVPSASRP